MLVHVTIDDILGAGPRSFNCPVQRALNRTFNTDDYSVGWRIIGKNNKIYMMPEPLAEVVHSYTLGYGMEPFSFEFEDL